VKRLITILILLLAVILSFAQGKNDTITKKENKFTEALNKEAIFFNFWTNDTVIKKGQKFRLSNWALEIGVGGAKLIHDKQTEKYLGNYWAISESGYVFYKNIFSEFSIRIGTLHITDTLNVGDEKVSSSTELDIFNMAISFGYNIDVTQSIAIRPYVGFLNSSFLPHNYSNTQLSKGFTAGFSLNKYFTLQPKRQLGIFIDGSYNQSNYNDWSKDLGKYFYAVEIGIEYKFWILKKIKND
jgi:hypothetical protein